MYLILFKKGENIITPLPYTAYFKINNNLDNLKHGCIVKTRRMWHFQTNRM